MTKEKREEIIAKAVDSLRKNNGLDIMITKYYELGGEAHVIVMFNGSESKHVFMPIWFDPTERGFTKYVKSIWPIVKSLSEEDRLVLKFARWFWIWAHGENK